MADKKGLPEGAVHLQWFPSYQAAVDGKPDLEKAIRKLPGLKGWKISVPVDDPKPGRDGKFGRSLYALPPERKEDK